MIALTHPSDLAAHLPGVRFLVAEFMYRPRPAEPHAQAVFDYAWRSRLAQLDDRDGVLLLCDQPATLESLRPVLADYPHLRVWWAVVNPLAGAQPCAPTDQSGLPYQLGWPDPHSWQRVTMTDRWVRIRWALAAGARYQPLTTAFLVMPAHDAVWGEGLLPYLVRRAGARVAVSPVTYHQHSPIPGVTIPVEVIDLLNAAFGKDALLAWKLHRDQHQGFWGKMSLLRLDCCGSLLENLQPCAFEDDLAIDSALARMGTPARGVYIRDPRLYRQALPVFDREAARRVIERTLHYSLNIPGEGISGSSLNQPLGPLGRLRLLHPRFRSAHQAAAALIAECSSEIQVRLERYGLSWVDWGAYRHVVRVGDPCVEVWKRGTLLV
ncbi:MAG TPA: hypothetical protein PLQ56_28325 [Aggregatilineales bacterium]|nr:hypothetical protein [Aggregatilineales bacterium]